MKKSIALIALGLLALVAGVAYAAIPASDGTISGCYEKRTGLLRVIDKEAGKTCLSFENPISWNQHANAGGLTVVASGQRTLFGGSSQGAGACDEYPAAVEPAINRTTDYALVSSNNTDPYIIVLAKLTQDFEGKHVAIQICNMADEARSTEGSYRWVVVRPT
jgi:hypothetical protein